MLESEYIHFLSVASHRVATITSCLVGHASTLSLKVNVGPVVSTIIDSLGSVASFTFQAASDTDPVFIENVVVPSALAVYVKVNVLAAEFPDAMKLLRVTVLLS